MPLPGEVHARRRRRLCDQVGKGAVIVLPAAPEAIRSNDVEYRYRQNSDFLYLTAFPEPEAVCVLRPGEEHEFELFVRPRDREREIWAGPRAGVEGACDRFGASRAFPIGELQKQLREYLGSGERLYYPFGVAPALDGRIVEWFRAAVIERERSGKGVTLIVDPRPLLHEMRLLKEPEELERMREAAAIAVEGHREAMRSVRPGQYEYEIEALLEFLFRSRGATGPAYPSIVASGPNATVLHYTANDRQMADGTLVLIDAGAELDGYCSDVTRTYPVGARFSDRQARLYEIVLAAQKAAIATVRPGARITDVHDAACRVLAEGLRDLGLLAGGDEEITGKDHLGRFYMHRTSHWLGLDVHDVGSYREGEEGRRLEPGMVLTVEPGLYVAADAEGVDEEWRGIGVRIEDDVLVTASGHEVLTAALPKELGEIETVRRAATPRSRAGGAA